MDASGQIVGTEHWKQQPRIQYDDFDARETIDLNTGAYSLKWTGTNDFTYSSGNRTDLHVSVGTV
jgi:hypothetical protein